MKKEEVNWKVFGIGEKEAHELEKLEEERLIRIKVKK